MPMPASIASVIGSFFYTCGAVSQSSVKNRLLMTGMSKEVAMDSTAERRKQKRFHVRDGAFAMLSLQLVVLGQIVNIGKGGLAFRYVSSQDRSSALSTLNIILTDGSFSLKKVPIQPVWDRPASQNHAVHSITVRHCGMRFNGLSEAQTSDLHYFIRHYTPGNE
jgi:hypothetical protein